jgi:hypothetical protein
MSEVHYIESWSTAAPLSPLRQAPFWGAARSLTRSNWFSVTSRQRWNKGTLTPQQSAS